VYLDQDSRADQTRTVKVVFAARIPGYPNQIGAGNVDVDFRVTIDDGTDSDSVEVSDSRDTEEPGDLSSPREIDRRILSAIESSQTANERVLAETVSRTQSSIDETTWRVIEADLDASSLAAGHAVVTVEAKGTCGPWVIGPILVQQVA
jgi:hypothetical protein